MSDPSVLFLQRADTIPGKDGQSMLGKTPMTEDKALTGQFAKILILKMLQKTSYFEPTERRPLESLTLEQVITTWTQISMSRSKECFHLRCDRMLQKASQPATRKVPQFRNPSCVPNDCIQNTGGEDYLGSPPLPNIPAVILFH